MEPLEKGKLTARCRLNVEGRKAPPRLTPTFALCLQQPKTPGNLVFLPLSPRSWGTTALCLPGLANLGASGFYSHSLLGATWARPGF